MGRKKRNLPQLAKRSKIIPDTNEIMIDPSQPNLPLESVFTEKIPDLSRASSKKKKRLERFIDTRLRKEERIKLLKELSVSCVKSDLFIPTKFASKKFSKAEKKAKNASEKRAGIEKTFKDVHSDEEEDPANEILTESEDEEEFQSSCSEAENFSTPQKSSLEVEEPFKSPLSSSSDDDEESSSAKAGDLNDYFSNETPLPVCSNSTTSKSFPQIPRRDPLIQQQRQSLPVFAKEQEIVEMINGNVVSILCGETGSGKTTQVPQFLYEYGYSNPSGEMPGIIGITQPRRVAAISMAQRVSQELNTFVPPKPEDESIGQGKSLSIVSHQIRFDSSVHAGTAIKFMTDGVLLKEVSTDFLLSRYSVIIVDEAHERNLNTDLLIGLLSRICKLREEMWRQKEHFPNQKSLSVYPLKLVIMSATLRVGDFTANSALFPKPPPVLVVEGKCFKVNVHFSKTTPADYLKAAYRKACFIHNSMPAGGILIFCTGKNEIKALCKKLREKFGESRQESWQNSNDEETANNESFSASDWEDSSSEEEIIDDDEDGDLYQEESESQSSAFENRNHHLRAENQSSITSRSFDQSNDFVRCKTTQPLFVVPLFSMLSPEAQMKAFQKPPADSRLVVVATNVAETSITIPNIKYVIDCGKVKERHWSKQSQIQSFSLSWISKSSAEQRSGRAGRTAEGHCYRLYSSAVFEREFPQHSSPEIQRIPIDSVMLTMKAMHIDHVVNFPFPSPPDRIALKTSEDCLMKLGAINKENSMITPLGRQMAIFPLAPRISKILVEAIARFSSLGGEKFAVLLAILCCISVGSAEFWIQESEDFGDDESSHVSQEGGKPSKKAFYDSLKEFGLQLARCDDFIPAIAFICWRTKGSKSFKFCSEHFIRQKCIQEVDMLFNQISSLIRKQYSLPHFEVNLSGKDVLLGNQIEFSNLLATGYSDQIVFLASTRDKKHIYAKIDDQKALVGLTNSAQKEPLFIHPSSVFWPMKVKPKFLCFTELQRSATGIVRMKGLFEVRMASS